MNSDVRPVPGFPGYAVSRDGRIFSSRPWRGTHTRELRGWLDGKGYRTVFLCSGAGKPRVARSVHSVVAEAFHGPRPGRLDIRHLDGVKTNCAADNLRYGTRSENERDKARHGVGRNRRAAA